MRWTNAAIVLAITIGFVGPIFLSDSGLAQDTPSEPGQTVENSIHQADSESEEIEFSPSQPDAAALTQTDAAETNQLDEATEGSPEQGTAPPPQTDPATAEIGASSATGTTAMDLQFWLILAVIGLSITTSLAVATSFYLYRWRRILAQPNMAVPENWVRVFRQVVDRTSKLDKRVVDMIETFMTLHTSLNKRDAEIRRLKKGYDAEVFRKFLYRFIKVHQALYAIPEEGEISKDDVQTAKWLMEGALDECDVQSFEPPLQVDWRSQEGIEDRPKEIETENPDEAFRIAEVVEPGYRLCRGEGTEVIVPAKVRIFVLKDRD